MAVFRCCKDCTKRHLHCHSTCKDYLEEKKKDKELKDKAKASLYHTLSYHAFDQLESKRPKYKH